MTWPAGLQRLSFGASFNQSLDNVTWPADLQKMSFGYFFNQSLKNVTWPGGLQSLTLKNVPNFQDLDVLAGALGHLAIGEMSLTCSTKTASNKKVAGRKAAEREFNHFPQMPFSRVWELRRRRRINMLIVIIRR